MHPQEIVEYNHHTIEGVFISSILSFLKTQKTQADWLVFITYLNGSSTPSLASLNILRKFIP